MESNGERGKGKKQGGKGKGKRGKGKGQCNAMKLSVAAISLKS